jgi:hypothetical protein
MQAATHPDKTSPESNESCLRVRADVDIRTSAEIPITPAAGASASHAI